MPPQPELGIALRFLDRLVVAPFGLLTPNLLTSGSSLPSLSTLPIRGNSARYGTPWRKRLRVATNSSLGAWMLFCQCKHGRQQLRGRRPVLGECRPAKFGDLCCRAVSPSRGKRVLASERRHGRGLDGQSILKGVRAQTSKLSCFCQGFPGLWVIGPGRRSSGADLWDQGDDVFLRLSASKTSTTGRGRVQHLKITDRTAIRIIVAAFQDVESGQTLFPKTPSAYRYRWNKLLAVLAVDPALRLTPGGLRGGGAVWCYRAGISIADIQWRMRLKHQATLEYYLQEVRAITALNALGDTATREIKAAAVTYVAVATVALNQ